jgi:hypothetical protein
VVEEHLTNGERRDHRDAVPSKVVLRPDPAPQEDCGREVGPRGENDGGGLDPLSRGGKYGDSPRPVELDPSIVVPSRTVRFGLRRASSR